jgi:pimeloyl-ACP methyl ester carboxylesterase
MRLERIEEGRGPLVVLLHGFPDTAGTWDHVRPRLAAAGFRAVSPYLRGYAPSPLARDYKLTSVADDVVELLDEYGAKDALVVGHDWGAAVAFLLAARGRVSHLTTIAIPHARAMRFSLGLAWKVRHFFTFQLPGAATLLRRNDFAGVEAIYRRWSPAWQLDRAELADVKRAFAEPGCLDAAIGYYRALPPPRELFARVKVPSLAFAGATDFAAPPAAYEGARRFYDSDYEVVTLPGGHFLHREHPGPFADELVRRLAARARTSA